jgi:hypothetical protein|tara:strand:- start:2571 stop:2816 length:246 start_codon:yes stop_codon:yes gene_type:complete
VPVAGKLNHTVFMRVRIVKALTSPTPIQKILLPARHRGECVNTIDKWPESDECKRLIVTYEKAEKLVQKDLRKAMSEMMDL